MFNNLIIFFMKKRNLLMLPGVSVVVVISLGIGRKNINSIKCEKMLLQNNIEALTDQEISEGNSECSGEKIYSDVGVSSGEATLRIHFADSIDTVIVEKYKKCYAKGHGISEGNNNWIFDVQCVSQTLEPCLGEIYHKYSIEDEQDF